MTPCLAHCKAENIKGNLYCYERDFTANRHKRKRKSYYKNPSENPKSNVTILKTQAKQRLLTELGRSVGVKTGAVKPACGIPTFPKQYDLIDMFNDVSRYLDDIYSPSINVNLRNTLLIYLLGISVEQRNTSTSEKEISFLDLNLKSISSGVYISFYDKGDDDKHDDFRFPIVYKCSMVEWR